jgi:hypothetical protein
LNSDTDEMATNPLAQAQELGRETATIRLQVETLQKQSDSPPTKGMLYIFR